MATLSHRERVLKALNHEETDRVPMDFGGASPTRIKAVAYTELVKYLGLQEAPMRLAADEPSVGVVDPSEPVLQRLDIDFRGIYLNPPDVNPPEMLNENSFRDEWGIVWARSEGGPNFSVRKGPLQREDLTLADLERHRWPDPKDSGRVKGLKEKAQKLRLETDYAIVLNLRSSVVEMSLFLRGFSEFLSDLVVNPALAEGILEHMLEVGSGIAAIALEEVGDLVDVVEISDDMGWQQQPFFRPELFRKLIKPYLRRLVDAIKSKTHAKVLQHNDGAIFDLIGDLIDVGIDAVNPVQVSARGMGDTRKLKAEFGRHICFWGAIDTHRVLPFGTPEDVAAEVKMRIDHLAPGGGYVLAPVHNIQDEVPPANVATMFDTARAYHPSRA